MAFLKGTPVSVPFGIYLMYEGGWPGPATLIAKILVTTPASYSESKYIPNNFGSDLKRTRGKRGQNAAFNHELGNRFGMYRGPGNWQGTVGSIGLLSAKL
jgi:hypothetical protein